VTIRAFIALIAYGAIWLSVRGQHPYQHPTAQVIPVAIALGIINVIAVVTAARRANSGVTGRSRLRPAELALVAFVWIGVFVTMAVLAGEGVSDSVVYGTYPAAVPLIAGGVAWAGTMATRANWPLCWTAALVAVLGIAALFAGPVASWAVVGAGLFIVLLARAAVLTWRQRRDVVRP
jgi:hypothetical protein